MNRITPIIDRIFAVTGAFLFSQFPQFFQSYYLTLGGHASELSHQIQALSNATAKTNKTIPELISKFLVNSDPDIQLQGEFLQHLLDRFNWMTQAFSALTEANLFTRPFVFMRYFDREIFASTYHNFQLGIPVSIEGFAYAFLGLLAGFGLFKALSIPFKRNAKGSSTPPSTV